MSALRTRGARYEKDTSSPAVRAGTPTSASSAATASGCARRCRAWALLNFAYRGSDLRGDARPLTGRLNETDCIGCGQCAAVCPTGAITIYNEIGRAWRALHDAKKRVVVQIAPAVRVAVGEAFGLPAGVNAHGQAGGGPETDGRRRGVRHHLRRGPDGDGGVCGVFGAAEKGRPASPCSPAAARRG